MQSAGAAPHRPVPAKIVAGKNRRRRGFGRLKDQAQPKLRLEWRALLVGGAGIIPTGIRVSQAPESRVYGGFLTVLQNARTVNQAGRRLSAQTDQRHVLPVDQ